MSIFQGLFRKTDGNSHIINTPIQNETSEIVNIRNEITELKHFIVETNSQERVSKKQRDSLMAKVINTLDKAENALVRASNE